MNEAIVEEYDAIVVGSGPGGSTVARQLSKAGKKVVVLEQGKDHQKMGSYFTALGILDKYGTLRSREGMFMLRAITTGGATVLYSASAAVPPPWLKSRYNINLDPWVDEIEKETRAGVLPENLIGKTSLKVMETANKIGYQWEFMPKFLDPTRFQDGRCCGTYTHLGCKCGAKWTAREYLKEAVDNGAMLFTETTCEEVIVENGVAAGVVAIGSDNKRLTFRAPLVVLAAGGLGSPLILKKAGIDRAGDGCYVDPTVLVYGLAPFEGAWQDPPVSVVSWEFYESDGIRLGTMVEPRMLLAISMARKSPSHLTLPINYNKTVGILVKVRDDLAGGIHADATISKPLGEEDHGRLNKGIGVATEILRALGCSAKSIAVGDVKGAHPSGTCRIGDVVNDDLETEINGLYVCDASVFPEALDRPTVITIIGFAKKLCDLILDREVGTA